jgi:hypothetical protein
LAASPVAASTNPSSPIPPNSGPAAEIKAIEAIAALAAGNSKGDAKNFGASVTDGFVAIIATGNIASKQDRMSLLAKRPDAASPTVDESRTRVYGDLAVTMQVIRTANGQSRLMMIHSKQGGKWLRAATVGTPIAPGTPTGQ